MKYPDTPSQSKTRNQTIYGGYDLEFTIFDTYNIAKSINRISSNALFCGMLTGKIEVSLGNAEPIQFLPEQSLVIPPDMPATINILEADPDHPTTCVCIEISKDKIKDIIEKVNEHNPHDPNQEEHLSESKGYIHFSLNKELHILTHQMVDLFHENPSFRDILLDFNIKKLLVRLIHSQARSLLIRHSEWNITSNGLATAVKYIRENIHKKISIEELASVAYMSRTNFFRFFRIEYGLTPVQFINEERIRWGCKLLSNPHNSITDICYTLGYGNLSYFIQTFKAQMGVTPKQYQKEKLESLKNR